MITYTERVLAPPQDFELFRSIRETMSQAAIYPLIIDGHEIEFSCHMVADALSQIYSPQVGVERGFYLSGYKHSWLRTEHRNIIDPYPIATIGGPLLIDGRFIPIGFITYIPAEIDSDTESPEYKLAVDAIEQQFRENREN
jgi:hypothetical protein